MTSVMRTVFAVFVAGIFAGLAAMAAWTQSAPAQTPSPNGAKVYFINLKDGQEVTSPFLVQFGLSGMGVAPAGVEKPNTGHHHLLIDTALMQSMPTASVRRLVRLFCPTPRQAYRSRHSWSVYRRATMDSMRTLIPIVARALD